jgi:hypothetical protein
MSPDLEVAVGQMEQPQELVLQTPLLTQAAEVAAEVVAITAILLLKPQTAEEGVQDL